MTHRPFDPHELDQPSVDAERPIAELESYAADTATGAPHGLVQRVMAAVEQEPAPVRGFLGWLLTPSGSGLRRVARASVLAATLVIAVAGAIFAGQLTGLIRSVGNGSPSEVESVSPAPSQSPVPTRSESPRPSTSPGESATESLEASGEGGGSPEASESAEPSENETPEPSSDGASDASKTPRPTRTASPSPTPHP